MEYKINEYITLKLEDSKTNIYINEKFVSVCKYLFINIYPSIPNRLDELSSIDEIEKFYSSSLERKKPIEFNISVEEEFWGHCSNLQAWVENDYNPALLHSNLSYPLLRELLKRGVSEVKEAIVTNIIERFEGQRKISDKRAFQFLLEFLTMEEIELLCDQKDKFKTEIIRYIYEKNGKDVGDLKKLSKILGVDFILNRGYDLLHICLGRRDKRIRELKLQKMLDNLLNYKWTHVSIKNKKESPLNTMHSEIKLETYYLIFEGIIKTTTREGQIEVAGFNGDIYYKEKKDEKIKITEKDYFYNLSFQSGMYHLSSVDFKNRLTEFLKEQSFSYIFDINRTEVSIKKIKKINDK